MRWLLFTSIIPDLQSFPLALKCLTVLFAIIVVLFSIIDVQPNGRSILIWNNDRDDGVALWRRALMTLSGVASFSGVLCVVLAAKGRYSTWFWGIINSVTFGVYAFAYGYAGDAQLNIMFFLPLQFVGMWTWSKSLDNDHVAYSRSLPWWARIVTVIGVAGMTVAFYYEIPAFAKAIADVYFFEDLLAPHVLDALTNAFNIAGQILMMTRFWEQWIAWIIVDIGQLAMFSGVSGAVSVNIIIMYVCFLINAFYGLWRWLQRARKQTDLEKDLPARGLVIGKFWPPHQGHMYLLNYAAARCQTLYIIVGERHDRVEVPSGEIRKAWLQKQFPSAVVSLIDDHYDQDDSELWAGLVKGWLGFIPDVVFTSESYGKQFCHFLGTRHVLVDLDRTNVPISATRIRDDPFGNWRYQTELGRQIYALRVVIVGAESTGKTTLAEKLAQYYNTSWVPECGREVTEKKLASGKYIWHSLDFVEIASVQTDEENKAAGQCNKLLICDTDAFATAIWHERYMSTRSSEVEQIADSAAPALYLLPDVRQLPFVQDGTRDGEDIREWMQQRFIERLDEAKRDYVILKGNYTMIWEQACTEIDKLLSSRHITLSAISEDDTASTEKAPIAITIAVD